MLLLLRPKIHACMEDPPLLRYSLLPIVPWVKGHCEGRLIRMWMMTKGQFIPLHFSPAEIPIT